MKPSLFLGSAHEELASLLRDKHRLVISGASNETAKALLVSSILMHHPRPAIVVTEDESHREGLVHWLRFFGATSYGVELPSDGMTMDQLRATIRMFEGKDAAVLTHTEWEQDFPLFSDMQQRAITLKEGQSIDFNALFTDLIDRGYEHSADLALEPGMYRRAGDTLDIFPLTAESPLRILFSFDVIEKIQCVDAHDHAKIHAVHDKIVIYPLNWEQACPLKDQLPPDLLILFDDQEMLFGKSENDELLFTAFPETSEAHVHLRYLSVLKFYTLPDFLNDVRDKLSQEWRLVVVTKRGDELAGILKEESISFLLGEESRAGAMTIVNADNDELLPHSIQNPDLKCALLTDREIFSLKKEAKQRSVQRLALDFITSLQAGDFVVHMEHGIGRFEGMTQKIVDDLAREYLEISYADNDKLFVPVDQADKLSKFVYEEGQEPKLTRLGSAEWKKVTKKVSEEAERIAKELLDIYAQRAKAHGFTYSEDNPVIRKFEEAFPYQETPGQIRAIQDIKEDMESGHPMDRLVCGDVGFGKTEVAMRAAFKAVQDGRQVAFVSPITILTNQHYLNMLERMKGFPVRIEMISRFRSQAEQKVILEKLRKGDIDIIVGTHRLLQDDVQFLNLGLVIIDEEQRFGVKQKEKLKSLRASVDILTMTATPIPRTLNLGLHKLRDITTITTPPPGRLPIITEVRKYSDALVRQAIRTELERKGQVYVLHNRVETIEAFAMKLRALVPEATFLVTHGQLKPELLEQRIAEFKEGKYDVLVSSTIIENGIDLPRANTLIVNEAEKFGLSQLYQLRGRVGRAKIQAFSYFLYHSQRLKDDAKKRLRAIVEASELGSGFQIAMRDLEIRGAGEILGASQSGNMQTVGVSHFLRMLKQAVEHLKSGEATDVDESFTTEILLPVEAFIPSFFVTDEQEKINVYQKLAGSENTTILKEFEQDLVEEYGDLPRQVKNLFAVLRLKLACRESGVTRIKMEDQGKIGRDIVLTLAARVTAKEIMQLLATNHQWKVSGTTLRINAEVLMKGGEEKWLHELTEQIKALSKRSRPKTNKPINQ